MEIGEGGIVELIGVVEVGEALRKGPESADLGTRPLKNGPQCHFPINKWPYQAMEPYQGDMLLLVKESVHWSTGRLPACVTCE